MLMGEEFLMFQNDHSAFILKAKKNQPHVQIYIVLIWLLWVVDGYRKW
jgi:hypothetical protein